MPKIAFVPLVALLLSGFAWQPPSSVEEVAEQGVLAVDLAQQESTSDFGEALLEASMSFLAEFVGAETGVDPERLLEAWRAAPEENQKAILAALGQVGKPYRYATSDPERGFDCSGLVAYAWEQAEVDMARNSRRQIRAADDVYIPIAGDLAYYPGHIMMYLGVDDLVVHAANRRTGVVIGTIRRDVEFGRPIPET